MFTGHVDADQRKTSEHIRAAKAYDRPIASVFTVDLRGLLTDGIAINSTWLDVRRGIICGRHPDQASQESLASAISRNLIVTLRKRAEA